MGLFDSFGEKHIIDGREIFIRDSANTDPQKKQLITQSILAICENFDAATKFQQLHFRLNKDPDLSYGARIDIDEARKGVWVVIINTNTIAVGNITSPFSAMTKNITHEIIHLYDAYVSPELLREKDRVENIYKQSEILMNKTWNEVKHLPVQDSQNKEFYLHRIYLAVFLGNFRIEGVTRYMDNLVDEADLSLTKKTFDRLYERSVAEANESVEMLMQAFNGKFSFTEVHNKIHNKAYNIGMHMVHTLLWCNPSLRFRLILDMSPFEFVRKYESVMSKLKIRPIVSLTSGNGIFDYKKMVEEWSKAGWKIRNDAYMKWVAEKADELSKTRIS